MTGIAVFAHGSSVESANEAVRIVVREMARKMPEGQLIEATFLEGGQPSLQGGVERLMAGGATRIVVVPYFLTVGLHLKRDLPALITQLRETHPHLTDVVVTDPLDGHPALAEILAARAASAIEVEVAA